MVEASSDDDCGVDADWQAWRNRTLNAILIAVCVLGVPWVVPDILARSGFSSGLRWAVVATYLLAVVITVSPSWGFRIRSGLLMAVAYIAAALALANSGLAGYGRLGLAVYPSAIIVLIGSRIGWISVGLSLAVYGVFAALATMGLLEGGEGVAYAGVSTKPWLLQGLTLALAMIPSVVALNRFRTHHMRLLADERRAKEQLQEEAARRATALESLGQEQAHRKRLEERISRLAEEERRLLGREIHDGLCQQLAAARLHCTALEDLLESNQDPAAARARRLRTLIEEMLEGAYMISKGVWPMGPEPESLVSALQSMIRSIDRQFGLACEFRWRGDLEKVDSRIAMELYRIAQEALHNCARHAKARQVGLLLTSDGDKITLEVTDDGCGPPDAAGSADGLGFSIMAHRARSVGGTLKIEGAEGGGTVVCCTVPCSSPAA
ncbi:MAG: Oxygen sensor histidine kinase NreB [Planctomycetes bacterium ADurb.Bin126]|nr:MAG: Oxygen sensor histidine kinase NreB [Planctomycetes bacterium ADurb.Bin126]HOD81294.1 histidine kinase [Phycisphaerae bacterium]HQL73872.1 histidine kinase [Phycisphaerae bacterium]